MSRRLHPLCLLSVLTALTVTLLLSPLAAVAQEPGAQETVAQASQQEQPARREARATSTLQLHATSSGVQIVTHAVDARLSLSGPDGYYETLDLRQGQSAWSAFDADGEPRADGVYYVEVRDRATGSVERGHFRLIRGDVVVPRPQPEGAVDKDQVFADDVIAERLCAGADCADGETFGLEALRLHSFNNHIDFVDSSGVNYATRDWRLEVNDTTYGGSDRFAVRDVDANTQPFGMAGGAPDYSLWIDGNGRLGLGTSTPAQQLHLYDWFPTVRLHQDAATDQVWDLRTGGYGHFELLDITHATTPLRVYDGAPSSSLSIDQTGDIGFGIQDPLSDLHIRRAGNVDIRLDNTNSSHWTMRVNDLDIFNIFRTNEGPMLQLRSDGVVRLGRHLNGAYRFELENDGDLEITGTLTQNSDVHSKTAFESVDGQAILEQVAALPITTWIFKNDTEQSRHMGPMAQDFHAAFGLGERPDRLAPVDVDGVTLAAVQALYAQVQQLQAQNERLQERLEELEGQATARP